MHNNIMAAGSMDRPPMLATGRYLQWRSRFLRYIDTRQNGDALRKFILNGPYIPTTIVVQAVAATDDSPVIPEHTIVETPVNMSPVNKAHFESKKEAIHLILTGIRDEIYSTIDACQIGQEMWEAIKRLQQGESPNIQDVKTNLFWEFGKFTSHDGETMESYYIRFYKLMNEMIQNNLTVATVQVNVQFLQQLQTKWSRFLTIVKQQHKLDEVSYHKLFDILKQYQKEVNELRVERLARNAIPLALVATAQANQDPYYQKSKSHKSYAPSSKPLIPTRSHTNTRYKGKEIAKPITPPSESASEEDSDPKQAQRDKDMQKNLALIANCLVALQNKQTDFEKYKAFNDRIVDYDKLEHLFYAPTAKDMEILIQTCLMPLVLKTQNDSFIFVHELKQEMHADLKYIESLEKEIDELESDKAEFSNMYDLILQECVSNEVMCSYLLLLSDLDALAELQFISL
nr:hypothetical protein [Tanacetum cinerariifolium]